MTSRLLILVLILLVLMSVVTAAPGRFPTNTMVEVPEGSTLAGASQQLKEMGVVRYPHLLTWIIDRLGSPRVVLAGEYWFEKPLTVWELAGRLRLGRYTIEPLKITVPEGVTVREMAIIFSRQLSNFDAEAFIAEALPFEGYLFPDTYFFPLGIQTDEIIEAMRANFHRQLKTIGEAIDDAEYTLEEIMVMASIIEEEAYEPTARRIIAGILWKRLEADMPLQVDAVFPYIIGKNSFELSRDDLRFDSPYNTYRYRGLPPAPITNPGLDAITAAAAPETSDYWYYLSDRQGEMYYAKDFDGHKLNRQKYLN